MEFSGSGIKNIYIYIYIYIISEERLSYISRNETLDVSAWPEKRKNSTLRKFLIL